MKNEYTKILKNLFSEEISKVRSELGYSQAKMAELLMIAERSYFDLERNRYCCRALTLVLFLIYYCSDPLVFLSKLNAAFNNLKDNEK